jgi:hypothetical protein
MANRKIRFVLRITGADDSKKFRATSMRATDLAEILTKIDSSLSALVKAAMGDDLGGISIVKISKGSLAIDVSAPAAYDAAVQIFGQCVESEIPSSNAKVMSTINALEMINYKNNTQIELKRDKKSEPFAVIKKGIPDIIPLNNEISGLTVIYGKVIGISGIERFRISFRTISGSNVDFYVTHAQVKEFGKRYNDLIGISGKALWDIQTNTLKAFELIGITEYEQSTPIESFSLISDKFHSIFDKIEDVDAFINEQRGE